METNHNRQTSLPTSIEETSGLAAAAAGSPAPPRAGWAGQVQWVVAGFALAVGAGVITAGRLGDLVGRRRMFALGLALFTASSAACGLAPSANVLVAARVMQGWQPR